jgi:hypothetical protein
MQLFKSSLLEFPICVQALIAGAALWAGSASAQLVAYDDASQYVVTTNWTNGANLGFGFTPWVILTNASGPGGYEGWYINPGAGTAYADAIITNVGGSNYSCVWGLYANGTNEINQTTAFRGFSNTLGTNTFKIQWGAREAGSTSVYSLGAVNGWCGFTLNQGNAANTPSDYETGERFGLYFENGDVPSTLYIWDNNGFQNSVPGTSFSNLGRDSITNAVQAEVTPGADGMSYHLVLKDVVAGHTFYTYDGVFNGGVGTEDSVALFDYETQSPGDQVYNRMQIAVPQIPPTIDNVQPANGSLYLATDTQLSFEVDSFDDTVSSNAVSVYLNGVPQTGATYNTASPTTQLLGTLNPVLAANAFYNYTIVAQDANGNSATNSFTFNTFSPTNTCIQAEDYNYNSGQYFPNPTPLEYANLLGSNGIDYLDTDTVNTNAYRPGNLPLPQLLPATDTVDHDMYFEDSIQDYQLGYTDAGSWENYTRSFPGTPFSVYARAASGGGGLFQVSLLANATATTTNQPLAVLGACNVASTGGSTVYGGQLTPMEDAFGNTVVLDLSGINTVRQTAITSQGYNLYYLMLVPVSSTNLLTPYISVSSPAPGATGVGLASPITFTIANRQTAVATNTIKLYVNTTNVTKLVLSSNAAGTSATYTLTNNMPANSTNTVMVVFNDTTGTNATTNTWSFVTAANGGVIGNGVWSGGGGFIQNWSTAANWTGGTPGPGYNAEFASPGATTTLVTNNIVDTNFTIAFLNYQTNNSGYHTTYIPSGVTLTVSNGSTSTGTEAFQVGGGGQAVDNVFNPKVTNTITGIGGTLQVLGNPQGSGLVNSLNFQVRQCANPAAPEQTVLDMSGLGTFIATVGKVTVGQGGTSAGQSNVSARVNLARTNILTLLRISSGLFVVGDSSGGAFTLPGSTLNLGLSNALFFDSMNVGNRRATNALVRFNPIFTNANPFVYIRDTNGPASRVSAWNVGSVNGDTTATTISNSGTVDFSGGTVDALVGTMSIGVGSPSSSDTGYAQGTLTLTGGTFNVTNLQVGVQKAANAASVTGTVNVNGAATLVSTNPGITLAQSLGGSGPTLGVLNITNGTVLADIAAGGGSSVVNLNGGTLAVTGAGTAGTSAAPLTALNLTGGTLQLNVNGSASTAIVSAASVTASGTTILISSVTNLTGTNTVHLISYTGNDPFAGFSLSLPYGYAGSLVDNSGSIDLTVMGASLPPPPTIGSIVVNGGQVILGSASNVDVAGGVYNVLTSTNLALPLSNWTLLNTGYFGSNGSFSSTNAMGTNSQQYYMLKLP